MTKWLENVGVFAGVVGGVVASILVGQALAPDSAKTESLREMPAQQTARADGAPRGAAPDQQPKPAAKTREKNGATSASEAQPPKHYLAAKWDPIHFKPAIDNATNAQCLACHQEIMTHKVREQSPAGVNAAEAIAWYQTLDTYQGAQQTFHARHLKSAFAKQVMKLKCNFCHAGYDPREEASGSSATSELLGDFKMRKLVNPEKSCLMCHGTFPAEPMGLEGTWHELREAFEDEDTPNGCLTCHQEQFRTVRHQVNYLKPKSIEKLAAEGSSDVCLGCHGGRAWYRNSYPYPRHPWPDMDEDVPDWAKDRPTQSAPEHRLSKK